MKINLNNEWKYKNDFREEMLLNSYQDQEWETVRIPHTNIVTPYHYFDEQDYQFICCYRKNLVLEKSWCEKKLILNFDGILHVAKIYINNKLVTIHHGGYTAFSVEISQYLDFSEEAIIQNRNMLVVVADSRETNNIPPFGNVIDYLTYGGMYREVYLEIKEELFFVDAFVTTFEIGSSLKAKDTDNDPKSYQVKVQAKLSNQSLKPVTIQYKLKKTFFSSDSFEKNTEITRGELEVWEKDFQFEFLCHQSVSHLLKVL